MSNFFGRLPCKIKNIKFFFIFYFVAQGRTDIYFLSVVLTAKNTKAWLKSPMLLMCLSLVMDVVFPA